MCAESERVKSKVGEVEGVEQDGDERHEVRDECETVINGVSGKTFVICVILKDCSPCGESLASF